MTVIAYLTNYRATFSGCHSIFVFDCALLDRKERVNKTSPNPMLVVHDDKVRADSTFHCQHE